MILWRTTWWTWRDEDCRERSKRKDSGRRQAAQWYLRWKRIKKRQKQRKSYGMPHLLPLEQSAAERLSADVAAAAGVRVRRRRLLDFVGVISMPTISHEQSRIKGLGHPYRRNNLGRMGLQRFQPVHRFFFKKLFREKPWFWAQVK